jgi:hypothetical protein
MDQFPSQSHKSGEPRDVQPVTRAPGRIRKAPTSRRLLSTFFQGDAQTTWTSMIWETFFPNLRDNIEDSVHNGISTLFGGTSSRGFYGGRRSSHSSTSQITRHNPDRALGSRPGAIEPRMSREDRLAQRLDVIEIDSRAEAEDVLNSMIATIDQYDVVRLAEFYQMVHISPEHTDYQFGWDDLGGAKIVHSRGAYFLDLPPLTRIK